MLRLRPYKSCDSKIIEKWVQDKEVFMKWGGDRFGEFPVSAQMIDEKYTLNNGDCIEEDNFYPWIALDDENHVVGHFIMRYLNGDNKLLRFGWVIVDDSRRGKGYGTKMLQTGLKYAFDILGVNTVTIGVFENNVSAHKCYQKVGFADKKIVSAEPWNIIEMAVERSEVKLPKVKFPALDLSMLQSSAYGGTIMNADQGKMIIRQAEEEDVRQIAEILVEDWKKAYRGIIDSDYLDSMSVEERYRRELQRYQIYRVAAVEKEILGFTWNEMSDDEDADCEIIAIYIRYSKRKGGIGKTLFKDSVDLFRTAGRKRMIIWCLRENAEARKFYEKMGGKVYKTGTHRWGSREYDMISYLYQLDESP